ERREGGIAVHAVGVVAGGDEQRCGGVGADSVFGEQLWWRGSCDGGGELWSEIVDLEGEGLVAAGEAAQNCLGGGSRFGDIAAGTETSATRDELGGGESAELAAELWIGGVEDRADLVDGLGPGLDRGPQRGAQDPHRF